MGAHPDDVEIGVGGILAAHRDAGDTVVILTMSRGAKGGLPDDRQSESLRSAELLGARLFLEDLVDTEITSTGPTIAIIERVIKQVNPTIVYTHSIHDRHQDHRAVHEAVLVAARSVDTVACFQSPSSTVDFRPSRFVSIDGYTEKKIELLQCFQSQANIRKYLEPDFVLATARYWSRYSSSSDNCEPLEIIRDADDLSVQSRTRPAITGKPRRARAHDSRSRHGRRRPRGRRGASFAAATARRRGLRRRHGWLGLAASTSSPPSAVASCSPGSAPTSWTASAHLSPRTRSTSSSRPSTSNCRPSLRVATTSARCSPHPVEATLAVTLDKWELAQRCAPLLRVPVTRLLNADGIALRWAFPVIVKPRRGAGSRGVRLVPDRAALSAMEPDEALIIQEHLPGDEFSVDVLADADGGVVAAVPRTRTRVDSGVSIAGQTVHDEGLEQTAAAVARAIGLRGVANVQLRRDADGVPALLEVNPRFPGALPLTIAAGVDMPSLVLDLALGVEIPKRIDFIELANVRFLEDVFVDPSEILRSEHAAHQEGAGDE